MQNLLSFLGTPSVPTWVVLVMALVPVVGWAFLFARHDRKPEPRHLLMMTGAAGAVCTLPLLLVMWVSSSYPNLALDQLVSRIVHSQVLAAVVFFIIVALVEEYVKHIGMILVVEHNRQQFDQVVDGVVYAVAAAMGFAFIENFFYLSDVSRDVLIGVFIARSLGATLGHATFSGTFGYFYGKAAFVKDTISHPKGTLADFHRALPSGILLHIIRTHILPHRGIMEKPHTRGELLAEGYWAAVFMHLLYDLVAASAAYWTHDVSFLLAPMLMFGAGWLFWICSLDENQQVRKIVVNFATLPEWFAPTTRSRKIRRKLGLSPGL